MAVFRQAILEPGPSGPELNTLHTGQPRPHTWVRESKNVYLVSKVRYFTRLVDCSNWLKVWLELLSWQLWETKIFLYEWSGGMPSHFFIFQRENSSTGLAVRRLIQEVENLSVEQIDENISPSQRQSLRRLIQIMTLPCTTEDNGAPLSVLYWWPSFLTCQKCDIFY